WQGTDPINRAALKVARDGTGSTLAPWDVNQDCITEHDRRFALMRTYIDSGTSTDLRSIAVAIRPILEAYIRIICPDSFPPGSLLGPFIDKCRQRLGTPREILVERDAEELRELLDYANRFHHDTNAAWETESINEGELLHFCDRTLAFVQRR